MDIMLLVSILFHTAHVKLFINSKKYCLFITVKFRLHSYSGVGRNVIWIKC